MLTLSPVHQRGEADQRLAAFADFHQLGQLAKGPGGVRFAALAVMSAGLICRRRVFSGPCFSEEGEFCYRFSSGFIQNATGTFLF
jgi:hypothetical protein